MHWHLKAYSLAIASAFLTCAGCGQSTYDARMANAPAMIKKRSAEGDSKLLTQEFLSLADSAGVKQGVKFKLPSAFAKDGFKSLGASDPNAKIAQADIPGFLYSIEIQLADEAGKQYPAYCYFYAVKKAMTPRADLEELIKQALGQIQNTAAWQPVAKPNQPPGAVMSITGNFDFTVNGMTENLPGQLSVHSFETDENVVLVGWLYENKSQQKNSLASAIAKAMDTATFDKDAAAPAPAPAPAP